MSPSQEGGLEVEFNPLPPSVNQAPLMKLHKTLALGVPCGDQVIEEDVVCPDTTKRGSPVSALRSYSGTTFTVLGCCPLLV